MCAALCFWWVGGWGLIGVAGLLRGGGPPCPQIWVAADCRHQSAGPEARHPEWEGPPRPTHGPATNGKAIALPLAKRGSSFAGALVRAQRKSNGEAQGKALPQTRAGPREGGERKAINHHPFPLAASPKACERKVILTSPFTVKGAANGGVKGERFSQTFPGPCLWPAAFLESLHHVRSNCFHLGRALARLQNCFAHFKGSANDVPMACRGGLLLRGGGPPCPQIWVAADCRHQSAGPEARHPEWEGPPRPTHGPATNGKAIALPLAKRGSSFAGALVRAQRKSNGEAQGKALPQTRAGPREGGERKAINHHPFPLAASPKACERKVILTSPFTVKGAANGGVKGERFSQTFPGPCLWPAAFLESLHHVRSNCFHLGRALARLQNCFAHFKGSANDVPMACRGGASRPRRAAPPLGSPGGLAPPWPRQARPSRMRFAATPFR